MLWVEVTSNCTDAKRNVFLIQIKKEIIDKVPEQLCYFYSLVLALIFHLLTVNVARNQRQIDACS